MEGSLVVIIAAGLSSRLNPLTNELPKSMLKIQDKPILHWALETFLDTGLPDSVVIGGYESDRLILPDGAKLILNDNFQNNNILHSLAYAREEMDHAQTVLISYSDIIFRKNVVDRLLSDQTGDITIAVDQNWTKRYTGRQFHPLGEAEGVRFNNRKMLVETRKGLLANAQEGHLFGEFIGMMKLTRKGQDTFWGVFDEIQGKLTQDSPFQNASSWGRAYLTDMFQELVNRGIDVNCALIQGGWLEIDTVEDFENAKSFDFADQGKDD